MLDAIDLSQGEVRETELRLQATDQLTVRVTSHFGELVANAHVRVGPEGAAWPPAFGRTDASGRAVLQTGSGAAEVAVSHSVLPARSRSVMLEPGVAEIHMRLDPGWEIRGTVRSVDGLPVPGAVVEAVQVHAADDVDEASALARRFLRSILPAMQVVSDEMGRFRPAGLDRGRYRLVARLPGFEESESTAAVDLDGRLAVGIDIVPASVVEKGVSVSCCQ